MLCDACEQARFGNPPQPMSGRAATETTASRTAKKDKTNKTARAHDTGLVTPILGASQSSGGQVALSSQSTNEPNTMILSELLCCIRFYRDKSNVDALRRVVLTSFLPANVTEAKGILVERFKSQLVSCPMCADRRGSSSRAAHEAELDDIIGLFNLLDNQKAIDNVRFVASNLELLPKFGPEELNVAAVVQRQVRK